MRQRAFVTGVSGFTGRHLAQRLLDEGWSVTGTVRSRTSGLPGVDERRVQADDWAGMSDLVADARPDVVFHLAAIVDTVTTPDLGALYRTNTIGTAALLDAVRRAGTATRVVVASSAFAYGRVTHEADRVPESAPLAPVTPYGASKAAAEAIAFQWWRQTGIDLVVARGFQHTGPGHVGAYALADWAQQLAQGAETLEVGNLDVVRDYLDVRDVAAAYVALGASGRAGEAYNVGSGVPRTMGDMLRALMAAFGREIDVRPAPGRYRTSDQPVFVADVSKLASDTRWAPVFTVEQTMRDLAESTLKRIHGEAE